jgi:hypothetical protein
MCTRSLINPPTNLFGDSTWRPRHKRLLGRALPGLMTLALILAAAPLAPPANAQNAGSTTAPTQPEAKKPKPSPTPAHPAAAPKTAAEPPQAASTPQQPKPAETAQVSPPAQSQHAHQVRDNLLIELFCALAVLLVLYPVLRFVFRQWSFRKDKLLGALAGDAIVYYYRQFRAGAPVLTKFPPKAGPPDADNHVFKKEVSEAYMASFRKDFTRWYGRVYYVGPVLMLAILTIVSGLWANEMLQTWAANGTGPGTDLRALVAASLAGAFMWVISDEIDRLRTRDFTTSDVYYYVFRILLAVPFAWALSITNADGKIEGMFKGGLPIAIPLAFFLGSFPTQTLFTIARRIGSQQLHLGDDQDTGNLELEKLQSIGKTNAERFKDEGISTITNLAYADPIDLTIRTNFDFSYVVDCVSQALTWIYFGDDSAKLFEFSLRGAQEIVCLVESADDPHDPDQARSLQTINDAAAKLEIPPDAFRSTLDQIAEDPYTMFLVKAWR